MEGSARRIAAAADAAARLGHPGLAGWLLGRAAAAVVRAHDGDVLAALRSVRGEAHEARHDPSLRLLHARVAMEAGQPEEARAAAQVATVISPELTPAYLILAEVEATLGLADAAEDHLRRAEALGVDDPEVDTALAVSLLSQGRRDEARERLASVLAEDPENRTAERLLLRSLHPPQPERTVGLLVLFPGVVMAAAAALLSLTPARDIAGPVSLGLAVVSLLVGVVWARTEERQHTPPELAGTVRAALRRQRSEGFAPLGRWPYVALLAPCAVLSALFLAGAVVERVWTVLLITTMWSIPVWLALSNAVRSLMARRRTAAIARLLRAEPGLCRCLTRRQLEGSEATDYARAHLHRTGLGAIAGLERYACERTGAVWLAVTAATGVEDDALPVLARLPGFHPQPVSG